ncbi:MAG TPA: T9SS type A sorting domain-containing protein, partial [Bacteroidota bacterium]|nr:T9SS type A sorting domain-containing protein [Bacteroidota bacterium]
ILGGAALLAYAIVPPPPQPAIADVYLGNYQLGALAINPITANGPDELSSHPAIDVDSIRVQGVAEEGALLVWNTQYQTGTAPIRHRVESNRFRYTGVPPAGTLEYPAHLLLDQGLTAPSSPDIARVINPFPNSSPLGVAVWEGGGEMSPCSPPRPTEIYGQFVIYDASLVYGGPQWAQPEMIGPGAGNYHQRGPMVKAAYPGEVSIFWLDSKNTENGILGTSLFDLGTSIRWIKRSAAETRHNARPAAIISSLWPQPSAGLASTVQLRCEGSAGSEASVELFDMLGRKVATLYSGEMREETLHVTFNPRRLGLGSGVYILRFSNAGTVASRNLHVTQ